MVATALPCWSRRSLEVVTSRQTLEQKRAQGFAFQVRHPRGCHFRMSISRQSSAKTCFSPLIRGAVTSGRRTGSPCSKTGCFSPLIPGGSFQDSQGTCRQFSREGIPPRGACRKLVARTLGGGARNRFSQFLASRGDAPKRSDPCRAINGVAPKHSDPDRAMPGGDPKALEAAPAARGVDPKPLDPLRAPREVDPNRLDPCDAMHGGAKNGLGHLWRHGGRSKSGRRIWTGRVRASRERIAGLLRPVSTRLRHCTVAPQSPPIPKSREHRGGVSVPSSSGLILQHRATLPNCKRSIEAHLSLVPRVGAN